MARLIVNPGSPGAWEIELKPGNNLLGRGFANDFKLNDASVSGSHCQITITDDCVTIKDLGSTNGTYVDRLAVQQADLKNGQVLHLGTVEMIFYSDGPALAEARKPAHNVRMVGAPTRATAAPTALATATAQVPPLPPPLPRPAHTPSRPSPLLHQQPPSFFKVVWSAFGYPLRGDGIILLIAGTVFFALLSAAKFFAAFSGLIGLVAIAILFVIGTGYLTCYLQRIITGTAIGDTQMPDWPDVTDVSSDLLAPFLQFAGIFFVSFLPAILAAGHLLSGDPWSKALFILALVYGGLYFPMAFLAVAMLDTIFALNPLAVVPPMFRMPLSYLFCCFLFAAVLVLWGAANYFFTAYVQIRFVSAVLFGFAQLYFLTVGVRVLGLLYWTNKSKFGWLNR